MESFNVVRICEQISDRSYLTGEETALIPDAKYQFAFVQYETKRLCAPKLVVWWRIITHGEHYGVVLPRYYNVNRLIGRAGAKGNFKVGKKSAFTRDWARIFLEEPNRLDRFPMDKLKNIMVEGVTKTVIKDANQTPLAPCSYYSVIDHFTKQIKP